MGTDPKYTILDTINGITLKKDDGITDAALIFLYEGGPETLEELFNAYDVVVTVDDARVTPERFDQDVPTHYPSRYPVTVTSVDKYSVGVLVCTATKMQWKMKEEIRSTIEAAAHAATYRLRIVDEDPQARRLGGSRFWETVFFVEYKDVD